MPQVVKEGRRSINNLQRSASLFLQKTIYSTVLGVLFIFLSASYPFEPIQLTFINVDYDRYSVVYTGAGAEQRAYKRQLFSERFEEIIPLCPDDDSWRFVFDTV